MSTFDLLFPSSQKVEKSEEILSNVEYDAADAVYRPSEEKIMAAWKEIVEAARDLSSESP